MEVLRQVIKRNLRVGKWEFWKHDYGDYEGGASLRQAQWPRGPLGLVRNEGISH